MSIFNLKEFVNLIKSLELSQFIQSHTKLAQGPQWQHQLGFKLTRELVKLDRCLNNIDWQFLDSKEQFSAFFSQLVQDATANSFGHANPQTAQAQKLLGFLLHHDIHVTIDSEALSLKALALQCLPSQHPVGRQYPFLSNKWLKAQHFPSLYKQSEVWTRYCTEQENQRIAKLKQPLTEQDLQAAIIREQADFRDRVHAYRELHFFDNVVLDLNKFSYVLEGFLSYGRLAAFGEQPWQQKPMLSPEVTQALVQFIHLVRHQGQFIPVEHAFSNMMKALIASAKVQGQFQPAAMHLLGFLLFHNFQFQYQNQHFRISDIFISEMSPFDYAKLQSHGLACMPFLSQDWQSHQCYPGKRDLEVQLSTLVPSPQRFTPYYSHQCTPMDIEQTDKQIAVQQRPRLV